MARKRKPVKKNRKAKVVKSVHGDAPDATELLPQPNAIFIGGGLAVPGMVETCWARLKPGGRLVANGVTLEAEQRLLFFQNEFGGDLTRMAVSRAAPVGPVGRLQTFQPLKQVTQLVTIKK